VLRMQGSNSQLGAEKKMQGVPYKQDIGLLVRTFMNQVHLTKCCIVVTVVVLIISLISRLLVDSSNVSTKGAYLVDKAMYWDELAHAENDPLLRIEHCANALAFMNAAREVATDVELETAAGIDISKTLRRLERNVVAAREAKSGRAFNRIG